MAQSVYQASTSSRGGGGFNFAAGGPAGGGLLNQSNYTDQTVIKSEDHAFKLEGDDIEESKLPSLKKPKAVNIGMVQP